MKIIFSILGLIFLLFSYFQFNDPDPEIWVPIYLMATLACYMALRNLWPSWVFFVMAVAYLVGAILQWPPEFEGVFWGGMKMRSLNIELARESLGLGACVVAMAFLGWRAGVNPPTAT